MRLRLARDQRQPGFDDFDGIFERRRAEADEFYAALQRDMDDPDTRRVHRQAIAGMLWTKQFYHYDIPRMARRRPAAAAAARIAPARAQQRLAPPEQRRHRLDARTNGNIRGTPPGTSLFTA